MSVKSSKSSNNLNPNIFYFPESSEDLQTISCTKELRMVLKNKIKNFLFDKPNFKFFYFLTTIHRKFNKKQQVKVVARCVACTNFMIFHLNLNEKRRRMVLVYLNRLHIHGDISQEESLKIQNKHKLQQPELRMEKVQKNWKNQQEFYERLKQFLKMIPESIPNRQKYEIVTARFNIDEKQYQKVLKALNDEYNFTLREFQKKCSKKNYQFRFLPTYILEINDYYKVHKKLNTFLATIKPPDVEHKKDLHSIDCTNPSLPNILMIVTPQMRQYYAKFGQCVGFDLTFSLIRQKPDEKKQYLIGVFAGLTESRRLIVFGLVVTNNQSIEAYKYIFRQFISIMGSSPESIVTDEELSLASALKQLKQERIFTGFHLLDTFHILKKFRKSMEGNGFQIYRKLIQVKDRLQYRKYFKLLLQEVCSDEEVDLIRIFDYNSEKYCISQIYKTYVGMGISDGMNEVYHGLIKAHIPYQSKYMKTIILIIDLIEKRNDLNRTGIISRSPLDETVGMKFMKPYRTLLSDKMFIHLNRENSKSLAYTILDQNESKNVELTPNKLEDDRSGKRKLSLYNQDKFLVKTSLGIFTVVRQYPEYKAMNEHLNLGKGVGLFKCPCQFNQKSGLPCSHIIRVLMTTGESFIDYIHPRWKIKGDNVDPEILKTLKQVIRNPAVYWRPVRVRRKRNGEVNTTQFSQKKKKKKRNGSSITTENSLQFMSVFQEQKDSEESNLKTPQQETGEIDEVEEDDMYFDN